ncbi:MAG: NAD-dependent epimerase/dehydratase family protein, partial [Rhodobacteraceae bacterium]|nr:NAD-dependent epimerase/dehydratase family protein [Paracoccaceae bacterium]
HTASPYVINPRDPVRDLLEPARRGTLAALEVAAASPRVRRVVLTSSMAAITDAPDGRILTEQDWNTSSSTRRNPYHHSKTEAERAAWAFMDQHRPGFDLVAINPFVVIGPAHSRRINTSNRILVDVLRGVYPAILAIEWGMVDVRDVARAHLEALRPEVPAGRYICAGETIDMTALVAHMAARNHQGARLPRARLTGGMGTALMKLAALSQPAGARSYLRTHLGGKVRYDTTRIRQAMGLEFRPLTGTLDDTLDDLAQWGHIGPRG